MTVTWHSSDGRAIIIAQMSFINLGQVHIWFRTSADATLFGQVLLKFHGNLWLM